MKKALALDVGGTKIYNTIINEEGEILAEVEKHPTPKTFDEIKSLFENIIKKYEKDVDVIAFSTCGSVNNEHTGIVGSTGNIAKGYPSMNFGALSSKKVFVENDANCAAWAEHILGASKGFADSVMITLGTGVGGGIIVDNKLKITAEEISGNPDITTYDVIGGMQNGDKLMTKIFNRWQEDIMLGLVGLANIFDPSVIVLSGSLAEFVDTDYLTREVNSQIVTTPTVVKKAEAGNYSGMIGAALLALEAV